MSLTPEQLTELTEARNTKSLTCRPTVPAMEEIMFEPIPVLDHGFVQLIDYMGDDAAVVQAARVSYGRGTKKVSEDRGLIRYLMRHRHSTPFEMAEIKVSVKLPIFIARQWIRHRASSYNEYSARYSILSKEFYLPDPMHMAKQSSTNRQGRGETLSPEQALEVLDILKADADRTYANYEAMYDPEGDYGLARELARINLTLNTYTQWYWKIDLHNFMHFLSLRADHHAQYEIRAYAEVLLDILSKWCPLTHEAFVDYRMGAASLSKQMISVVQRLISGEPKELVKSSSNLTKREWDELMVILTPSDNG